MFRKTFYLYIAFVCFVPILNSFADSDLPYKKDEVIVRFAPKANGLHRSVNERNQILSSLNAGEVKHSTKLVPGLSLVKLPANLTVTDALSKLKGKSEILYVEPNYKIKIASTFPDDPNFNNLWGLHNTGQGGGTVDADIDAPEAWDIRTDSDVIVAVIDSGVDYTHPDLIENRWVNWAELLGTPGIDDDGNGYIDDVYGWDFCRQ